MKNWYTFEYFVETYGARLRYIHFFKNKMVEDLSPLGALPELEGFRFFYNQRVTRLWDMRGNKNLKFIDLTDFSRLHDLDGVQRAPALEWFSFGDRIWSTSVADSYRIFRGTGVRRLDFSGKAISDMDLSFVLDMPALEEINLPTNLFTTEQNAWVAANRPDVRGYSLRPSIYFPKDNIGEAYALIVGKRKPSINIAGNEERIRRYEARFQELAAQLKGAPWSSVATGKGNNA